MVQEKQMYLSWYDKSLREIISVEKTFTTKALINQLKKEDILIVESLSESIKDANKKFLQTVEEFKTIELMGSPYYEMPKTAMSESIESELHQHVDKKLDEAMGFYQESAVSTKKKNSLN